MAQHSNEDHVIEFSDSPYGQMRAILARHLCAWITGHAAPVDHFLTDADMILNDAHVEGIRFHTARVTANSTDGFVFNSIVGG